jgi:hypothetical protein
MKDSGNASSAMVNLAAFAAIKEGKSRVPTQNTPGSYPDDSTLIDKL